ncbi:hypothetical protein CTI12_AA086390 [Artemisia annua]|uniref:Bromo adjacent homology (BAH) domain, Zinc finger, RING/FYVE/PHD-type n=1 Tax=Artemisia annua TaxID=35608 RepID=A0A2U1P2H8_ARTAN|nr:hypothetical protein CTI12_AA086390 [Artemisia annua]
MAESVGSYVINKTNVTIKSGNCALFRSDDLNQQPPHVGRVESLEPDENNNVIVKVTWYYRPEETSEGRKSFHGDKEVILSDHQELHNANTIIGKCDVHSLAEYIKLKNVEDKDYFSRFEYMATKERLKNKKVATYCKCGMPLNPDVLMVGCDGCDDWFHPACMKSTNENVQKLKHFFCPSCLTSHGNTNMLFSSSSVPPSREVEVQNIQEDMEHMQQKKELLRNEREQHQQAMKENKREMRELDARIKEMQKWIKALERMY